MRRHVQCQNDFASGHRRGVPEPAYHAAVCSLAPRNRPRPVNLATSLGAALPQALHRLGKHCLSLSSLPNPSGGARHPRGLDYGPSWLWSVRSSLSQAGFTCASKGQAARFETRCFFLSVRCLRNLIGTIGASMLLIRPWIAMNRGRVAPMHIAFFIFLGQQHWRRAFASGSTVDPRDFLKAYRLAGPCNIAGGNG